MHIQVGLVLSPTTTMSTMLPPVNIFMLEHAMWPWLVFKPAAAWHGSWCYGVYHTLNATKYNNNAYYEYYLHRLGSCCIRFKTQFSQWRRLFLLVWLIGYENYLLACTMQQLNIGCNCTALLVMFDGTVFSTTYAKMSSFLQVIHALFLIV